MDTRVKGHSALQGKLMGRKYTLLWILTISTISVLTVVSGLVGYQQNLNAKQQWLQRWGNYYTQQFQLNAGTPLSLNREALQVDQLLLRYGEKTDTGLSVLWENTTLLPVSLLQRGLQQDALGQDNEQGQPSAEQLSLNDLPYLVQTFVVDDQYSLVLAVPLRDMQIHALRNVGWMLLANLGLLFVLLALSQSARQRFLKKGSAKPKDWEHIHGIAFLCGPGRYISDVNPVFRDTFGPGDGHRLDELLEDEEKNRVLELLQQAAEHQQVQQFECFLNDLQGQRRRWSMRAKPWGDPERKILLLHGDDISLHNQMAEDLKNEQQRFADYFHAMPLLLAVCDRHGNILRVNQYAQDIVDRNEEELLGSSIRYMLPRSQTERLLDIWRNLITSDINNVALECPLVSSTGKEAMISWHMTKVVSAKTGELEVILAGQDITETLANRDALERANSKIREALTEAETANHSKSVFLASMSHEIRTPMNGILGAAELLLDSDMDAEQQNYLGIIHSSSHVLLDIINDILDLSKIESGNLEIERIEFDLNRLLSDLYQLFHEPARRKGLSLVYFCAADLPTHWRGDPKRIRQIVTNLVNNALKFTENGHVEIRLEGKAISDGRYQLDIAVTDTGIGISDDKLDRVFSAFRQADTSTSRKYGGTGLGLTISRHLAQAMGGDIQVESGLGTGSRFCLTLNLPMATKAAAVAASSDGEQRNQDTPEVEAPPRGAKVLLAEDNHVNQRIAVKMLQRLHISCDVVENGEQAVTAILQQDYDLILMDVNMPVLDGIAATERIRDLSYPKNQVPILALTANAMMEDKDRCLKAGMNGFVSKPIKLELLSNAIAGLLNRG